MLPIRGAPPEEETTKGIAQEAEGRRENPRGID
jgi:hypothetical protein